MNRILRLSIVAALWAVAASPGLVAIAADGPGGGDLSHMPGWIADLSSDQFAVREQAVESLRGLAAQPAAQAALAKACHEQLLRDDTPLEARAALEGLAQSLPAVSDSGPMDASDGELARLVAQIDGDSYSHRLGADYRLRWMAGSPRTAWPVTNAAKRRMTSPGITSETFDRLDQICEIARATWLTTDPATWPRERPTDVQISTWIAALASPAESELGHKAARRGLVDAMANDDQLGRVRQAIEARQAQGVEDPLAQERLKDLHDWCRPALVAELWQDQAHDVTQYLLVGVAQQVENAPRPTLFDRVDDRVAHCASGTSLAPGDYPLGIAIPPTTSDPAITAEGRAFQLLSLPTARRRLMFEYDHVRRDEVARLAELTQRTTDWFLKRKRPLSEREILMLPQLDQKVVAKFVRPYLMTIDDEPLPEKNEYRLPGRNSRHGIFCYTLAECGSSAVVPAIVEAVEAKRILSIAPDYPYSLPWAAALGLAASDPWPEVDEWLANLIARTDPLTRDGQYPAELGATAAALLLVRHEVAPSEYGLVQSRDPVLFDIGCLGHVFASKEKRAEVQAWWKQVKSRVAKNDGRHWWRSK